MASEREWATFRAGMREATPFAIAVFVLAITFGVVAREEGLSPLAAVAMAALVNAGSAQFAALGIVSAGGSLGTGLVAAALINSRFLAMGVAVAPYLPGGWFKRALQGQTLVDASWAIAKDEAGRFDRFSLFGATVVQYVPWVAGALFGATVGTFGIDPDTIGVTAISPAFFTILLVVELRRRETRPVAALGAVLALGLIPLVPVGVPVVAASAAALVGLRRGAAR